MAKTLSTPKSKGQTTKTIARRSYTLQKQPGGRFVKTDIRSIAHIPKPSWWNEHFKK